MTHLINTLLIAIAILHIYFLILEMFLWEKPIGLRTFGLKPDFAKASRTLASNQGLYNGFLAAGLIWGVYLGNSGMQVKLFFLSCITIAGVFGGFTASRKIIFTQAMPAAVVIILLLASA